MKIRFPHLLFVLFIFSAVEVGAYTDADCIKCHDRSGQGSTLKMSVEQFNRSVHAGEASCRECHVHVKDDSHEEIAGSGAVDCTACHDQENHHGPGMTEGRPRCFSCHTRHQILSPDDPQSSVHPDRLDDTCRTCHPVQCGQTSYLSWFTSIRVASHPKQDFSQVYTQKNCLGCHQGSAAHGEAEPVNDQNCATCHLNGDGQNQLWGVMHPEATLARQPGVFVAAVTYQLALAILVLGGFRWLVRFFSKVSKRKE